MGIAHVAYVADDGEHTGQICILGSFAQALVRDEGGSRAEYSSLVLDSAPTTAYFLRGQRNEKWGPGFAMAPLGRRILENTGHPEVNPGAFWILHLNMPWTKKDNPTISFYDYEGPGGVLYFGSEPFTGWRYWEARTRGPGIGSGQVQFQSPAIPSGTPHLAYANVATMHASLRYAHWTAFVGCRGCWRERERPTRICPSPYLDTQNVPHIAYTDMVAQVRQVTATAPRADGFPGSGFAGACAFPGSEMDAFGQRRNSLRQLL